MVTKQERRAEAFVLGSAAIGGGFPIIANQAVRVFPAFAFAGMSAVVGACSHLLLLLVGRTQLPRISRQMWVDLMGVALCNSVFALVFIFLGTQYTSGINTALLMQSEMLFSFLVFTFLFGERAAKKEYAGAFLVFLGTVCILYNGSFAFNRGDLLIILGTVFYPFGNRFAKRALLHLPASFILMFRCAVSAVVFLTLSVLFGDFSLRVLPAARTYWWLIVLYGVVVLVGSNLCWYRGLRALSLTKAVSIILSSPVFSLLFAAVFLKEIPTMYQIIGFVVTLAGLSVLISRRPLPPLPPDLV
ncbi:hypothetical protein A2424_01440 [Candidatus Peribacteria bacterium RIFOXYC1_FULL_54_13]|nr:MAG: hypothetical protein UY87_C0028G0015 [Candidatus Peribacteria bacterium GW2011_GWC2_54_8]KKW44733.1 MAG: hypothetical protein UY90_C0002G0014 [Candidatus Peregrinibacteria bacterium GW2011_GWA2_54_9]OGJ71955.1 MAG: hypothetical protein A2198_03665 [Candidatus Peribacteria bacterium RIFOXYA1_FULL_56_14]OGJ73216.1 MAG: hypothetical protein A2217_03560 [Candidatus Peribacteria bacterium RIFOXYA2_FULL_55_28]OGJ75397.1 MAG: hypothetical protein A2384_00660 [Candidatus Peribacteria bacterium 